MKILVVGQHYKPEPFPLSDLCETLVSRGHEVHVVTGMPNYPMGVYYPGYESGKECDEVLDGVHVHRCALHPRKPGTVHRVWNYYSFVCSSCRYIDSLDDSFDVVYCNQSSPVMMSTAGIRYAKKHGKRCVLYCMDIWPECLTVGGIRPGSAVYRYYLGVSRRIYAGADELLLSSRRFAQYFSEVLSLGNRPMAYCPQYAEAFFEGDLQKTASADGFHLMYAGNLGMAQNLFLLIDAARLLQDHPEIRIHLVGDGSELEVLKARAADLPNVTFHGRHPKEEMPDFFRMADAMFVSLTDDSEVSFTLPGKVQAYMAAGKPIVGAVGGETAEVLAEANCGVCIAPNDAEALAQEILAMALQPEKLTTYGNNARAYYQRYFSKASFVDRIEEALSGDKQSAAVSEKETVSA